MDKNEEQSELSMFGELRVAIITAEDRGRDCALLYHALEHLKGEAVRPFKQALFTEIAWRRSFRWVRERSKAV